MDFKEKSEHYFRIAHAMREAGKSESSIEAYLRSEELDHNEVFLVMDRLDDTGKNLPAAEPAGTTPRKPARKLLGIPLKIIGSVFVILGIGLGVMKLFAGTGFDRGYVVAVASILVGVIFFIQGRGS